MIRTGSSGGALLRAARSLVVLATLFAAAPVLAQEATGIPVTGVVRDASGAVVSGARVAVVSTARVDATQIGHRRGLPAAGAGRHAFRAARQPGRVSPTPCDDARPVDAGQP